MYITAQGPRLQNDLYCVECDVKLYYTIPYLLHILVGSGPRTPMIYAPTMKYKFEEKKQCIPEEHKAKYCTCIGSAADLCKAAMIQVERALAARTDLHARFDDDFLNCQIE